jgi:DNA repair protein RadC
LAEDFYQHFVIIEIKRSDQKAKETAKEAIHQVLKYVGLFKQQMKVKESEIRICIVLTDWDELIVSFSDIL